MNKTKIAAYIVLFLLIASGIIAIFLHNTPPPKTAQIPQEARKQVVEYENNPYQALNVEASKIPEVVFDISDPKFSSVLSASQDQLKDLLSVELIHKTYAEERLETEMTTDTLGKKLKIKPSELANFRPGLYKLSVKLRNIEGEVDLNQDFAWGVIAVNTNKSIYKPGETVKLGFAVLDDTGETMCFRGFEHVQIVEMTITDPTGETTHFSTKDESIFDSGECSSISVTNEADFQALYKNTNTPGVYQMRVKAVVKDITREIEDYFKVDPNVEFDVERTSFPTRIYPPVMYPNTFTVTAKSNYKGKVTEIVPAMFKIQHVSDNGKIETIGDFKRIVWDTTLEAGKPKQFSYFIRFPMVSPEFYLLGPIKIGDFQEARQWQIASDVINSTSGVVSYEDNASSNTWSRLWTGTTWSPTLGSTATSLSTAVDDGRWFIEKSNPKTGEKIVGVVDNVAANDELHVFDWNGSSWTLVKNFAISSTLADETRPMDIAYEELSGDAIFVYSDYANAQIKYYKKVSGTWDAGTTAAAGSNAGSATAVYKRWIRLEPQFESDTILLGYLNNDERVGAMIWDGASNTWGSQLDDAAGTQTATSAEQAFDIAWETSSGTPMIFWGTTGNLLTMREFTGGTWQAETTVASGFTNDSAWVFAAADPVSSSNNISLAIQDGTACVARFGVWTGAAATMNATTVPTCASVTTNNLVDTAFENNTGKAMWVYVSSATTNRISWLTWTSGGGFTLPTTELGTTTGIESISLFADLNTTSMMLLYHDNSNAGFANDCQLWHREWDGSSWSALGVSPVHARICSSADNNTLPYGFGFDRNLETLVAYRWFANSVDLGASLSPLTAQDTPYTLTTQNQAFRLRLLLYYPDSLLSSALRLYKLQYVDPGSGTCANPTGGTPAIYTDVPTSGGTTISFNDNLTLNDGDNIATSSADPTYQGLVRQYQDYEEFNTFTNSRTNMAGNQVSIWDFSLIDNTPYDRIAQTYCFRVARNNNLVLRIGVYPQIATAALPDVLIQGGTIIRGGVRSNN